MELVSCLMPTYRRFPANAAMVGEAVESFLRQDYENKELILCNDEPEQRLSFDHPQVFVINLESRCRSLGAKTELMARAARGTLLCRWDDDDINLPHRLSLSVEMLGGGDAWEPMGHWFMAGSLLSFERSGTVNMGIWRRRVLDLMGGYPDVSDYEDSVARDAMSRVVRYDHTRLSRSQAFYIHRWGDESYHMSRLGPGAWQRGVSQEMVPGEYEIVPAWLRDYSAAVATAI